MFPAGGLTTLNGTAAALAPNATGSSLALSGSLTALQLISTQTNGNDGLKFNNTGARAHLGPGTFDYLRSDGASTLIVGTADQAGGNGNLAAKVIASAAANSAQVTFTDTTNAKSFYLIVNNSTFTLFNNAVAELCHWTESTKQLSLAADLSFASFTDDSATTGNRTVNSVRGFNAFAAASSSIVITNSFVTALSQIVVTIMTADATALLKNVVPAAGSFTITLNANTTGITKVAWTVIN